MKAYQLRMAHQLKDISPIAKKVWEDYKKEQENNNSKEKKERDNND